MDHMRVSLFFCPFDIMFLCFTLACLTDFPSQEGKKLMTKLVLKYTLKQSHGIAFKARSLIGY